MPAISALPQAREWFLEGKPEDSDVYSWCEEGDSYIIDTRDVRIVIGKISWKFEIYDRNGVLITRQVREWTVSGELEGASMGFGKIQRIHRMRIYKL